MLRAQQILTAEEAHLQGTAQHTVTLDGDQRYRRRIALQADDGLKFLLDLPKAVLLRHGDGLRLNDGRIVKVLAVPEELLEVRARDGHHMLQIAWHLGNRHLEAQIDESRILIRRDHVIADMLHALGADVREVVEPFTPEAGAYSHQHSGDHSHDH